MKRILMSLGAIVFVGAVAWGATGAFFSDTETSTGNTFSAGSVDLTITGLTHTYNGSPTNQPTFSQDGFTFNLSDLKPVDSGKINYTLGNGSNQAYICAAVVETGNNDNGINNPESKAGDTTDGAGNGELGQFLTFMFGSTTATTTLNGAWQSLGIVNGSGATSTSISYCFGQYAGGVCQDAATSTVNIAQTDSLTADVQFYAVQTRNNPNFTCASLPPATGTAPTSSEVNVTANALNGWQPYNDAFGSPASTTFVADAGAPVGSNVLRLETGSDNNTRVGLFNNTFNLPINGAVLSYDSKQVSASDVTNGNATMRIWIDTNGDNTADDQLMYEPYYNGFNGNTMTGWQTWSVSTSTGKFWSNNTLTYNGLGGVSAGSNASNFTLSDVLASYPSAKIVGISFSMGTYNPNQVILVDNFKLDGTTYDFGN